MKIDVIIPTYRPDREFPELLKRLQKQILPVNKIIIVNTEKKYWNREWESLAPLEVHHISKADFDHASARMTGAACSDADLLLFMTQDALPKDRKLTAALRDALFADEKIAAAFARQLPKRDCSLIERITRSFNYPEESCVKSAADLESLGIKTFFCSNVCALYKKEVFAGLGGFVPPAIFNEDMVFAAAMIRSGYKIAYAADACVCHSHNYTPLQQLRRNFDLGVSQKLHPEVFKSFPSEGEGLKLVKRTMKELLQKNRWDLIPKLLLLSAAKYTGYRLGKHYELLPEFMIKKITINPQFWDKNTEF